MPGSRLIDLAGWKFGRLCAIARVPGSRPTKWRAVCDCGTEVMVRGRDMRRGETRSCGCLQREISANHLKKGVWTRSGRRGIPKLTESQARQALALLAAGKRIVDVAGLLDVAFDVVSRLKRGKSWKGLRRPEALKMRAVNSRE